MPNRLEPTYGRFHIKSNKTRKWYLRPYWDVTQRRSAVSFRRLRTTYRSKPEGSWTAWSLKMRPIGCPETSVANYQPTLRKIPEQLRFTYAAAEAWNHAKQGKLSFHFILFTLCTHWAPGKWRSWSFNPLGQPCTKFTKIHGPHEGSSILRTHK
jgi:hypothetical protein